ncbi:hypothetical protein JCM14124_18710 [Humidesulfovibrio idahonensis]
MSSRASNGFSNPDVSFPHPLSQRASRSWDIAPCPATGAAPRSETRRGKRGHDLLPAAGRTAKPHDERVGKVGYLERMMISYNNFAKRAHALRAQA